jgi:hypothetical protein
MPNTAGVVFSQIRLGFLSGRELVTGKIQKVFAHAIKNRNKKWTIHS